MRYVFATLLFIVAAGCKGADDEDDVSAADVTSEIADTNDDGGGTDLVVPDVPDGSDPHSISTSVTVRAVTGGSVVLGDGTRLDIPAGSLASDTVITIRRAMAEPLPAMPGSTLASLQLEPEGLVFATPARITVPIGGIAVPTDEVLLVVTSTLNEIRDVGGEETATDPLVATVSTTQVSADLAHFSVVHVLWVPRLFAAFEIPGRYLRTGDILYSLTNGENHLEATMIPIHVGLFDNNADHDGTIESTLPTAGCPTMNGVSEGVYDGDCGFRSLNGQHVFLGVRRPNQSVTIAQGLAAVAAARVFRDTSYGIVGLPTDLVTGTGMSCVQLAEDAWERAGVNISYTPDVLLTPSNQYANTVPVESILVDAAGGPVRLPIVVAVRTGIVTFAAARAGATVTVEVDNSELFLEGRYRLEDAQQPAKASGKYGPQAIKDLVFEPAPDDLGKSYTFTVAVNVPSNGQSTTLKMRIEFGACGNSNVETGEECEPDLPNTCTDGKRCNAGCHCSTCGNGMLDAGETCDRSAPDPGGPTFGCSLDSVCQGDCTCKAAVCGDGRTEPGEECDPVDSTNLCGVVHTACNVACECAAFASCGDGDVDAGEQCDYKLGPGPCGTGTGIFAGYEAACVARECKCQCKTFPETECVTPVRTIRCKTGQSCDPANDWCRQDVCPEGALFDGFACNCQGGRQPVLDPCRSFGYLLACE